MREVLCKCGMVETELYHVQHRIDYETEGIAGELVALQDEGIEVLAEGVAGRIIRTNRQVYLRFSGMIGTFRIYAEARRKLFEFAQDP